MDISVTYCSQIKKKYAYAYLQPIFTNVTAYYQEWKVARLFMGQSFFVKEHYI